MKVVLCIDDDNVAQRLYGILLKNAGFDVVTATSASSAIEKLELQSYAAIILDYMMPEVNGLELASRIRRHSTESVRNVPIIVSSASLDRKAVQQFSTLAVRHFLVKPVDKEGLKQTLLRAIGSEWDGKAIQSLELICHNLGLEAGPALELLKLASQQLQSQYDQLREAALALNETGIKLHCPLLRSTLGNLGLRSDDEWMMETRGVITAIEAACMTDPAKLEASLKRLEECLSQLARDLEKLSLPPSSEPVSEPAAAPKTESEPTEPKSVPTPVPAAAPVAG